VFICSSRNQKVKPR